MPGGRTGGLVAGPLRFARFAYPPNALGYCGGTDAATLLGQASLGAGADTDSAGRPVCSGRRDLAMAELAALARQFAGAWPYLQLIAAAAGRRDPLDAQVVEAYWLGNQLLRRVDAGLFAAHLSQRFELRAGRGFADLATLATLGAVPHHNFHVFAVYPWVGLLREGRDAQEPMRVLNACRIRWGRVVALHRGSASSRASMGSGLAEGFAEVESQPLCWDGYTLHLGRPTVEQAIAAADGAFLDARVQVGDLVALHWDWICEVLDAPRVAALQHYTASLLALTNHALRRPTAAAILD
jgi:hypothetical protein